MLKLNIIVIQINDGQTTFIKVDWPQMILNMFAVVFLHWKDQVHWSYLYGSVRTRRWNCHKFTIFYFHAIIANIIITIIVIIIIIIIIITRPSKLAFHLYDSHKRWNHQSQHDDDDDRNPEDIPVGKSSVGKSSAHQYDDDAHDDDGGGGVGKYDENIYADLVDDDIGDDDDGGYW